MGLPRRLEGPPLYNDLDVVLFVVLECDRKIFIRESACDQFRKSILPSQPGIEEIVHSHLEMVLRRIDAADHDLVPQYEGADQLGTGQPEGPLPARDSRQHVNPIEAQGIEQIELERSN